MTMLKECPNCKAPLRDRPVPEHLRSIDGYYYRTISVQIDDRHDHWKCPDCGYKWR